MVAPRTRAFISREYDKSRDPLDKVLNPLNFVLNYATAGEAQERPNSIIGCAQQPKEPKNREKVWATGKPDALRATVHAPGMADRADSVARSKSG